MAKPQKIAVVCFMMVLVVLTIELSLARAAIHRLLDCSRGKYGCCPDGVTYAYGNGSNSECSASLCYDKVKDCATRKSKVGCYGEGMRDLCPKTCKHCRSSTSRYWRTGPSKDCVNSKYGCCYDDVIPATKKDKRPGVGCPRCYDLLPHTCGQFGTPSDCRSNDPRLRQFLKSTCFKKCGICTNFKEVEKRKEVKGWRNKFY
ncbi:papilin-like [Actinia tenebrosa]|uniref:Papilin-like n=1 Tax=Actinia tenebrosa TaxID=6105 RepID=A0A6P8IJY8_ACTTE|nr:papilin-like [Actinia tenebrosa]